jgi:hypothetical protein
MMVTPPRGERGHVAARRERIGIADPRPPGPGWVLATAILILVASCTPDEGASGASSPSPSATALASPSVTSSPSRRATHPHFVDEEFTLLPEHVPYPYTKPTPPPEPTPLDGTYLRILTLEDVGGLLPFRCVRCPPYLPNAGVSTLAFYQGNYWLNHQLSDFRALGMFTVRGDRITFFNDPWCPRDRGTYRWTLRDGELTFEAISGTCVYEEARAEDLSRAPWTKIKPCIFLIEHLWPGPIAC